MRISDWSSDVCSSDLSERSVTPVASAGGGRTYLDTLRVSWGSSDTGIGPVGRAIRSRKMVVVDDIASDPGFAHWRQFALDKGFSCAFAVPVIGKSDAPDLDRKSTRLNSSH